MKLRLEERNGTTRHVHTARIDDNKDLDATWETVSVGFGRLTVEAESEGILLNLGTLGLEKVSQGGDTSIK